MENQSPKRNLNPVDYWTALKDSLYEPNFWMSPEFIDKAQLDWVQKGELWGWIDASDEWFLPPMDIEGTFHTNCNVFAGFPETLLPPNKKVLDRQYIYDARNFKELGSPKWKVFRKNIRKYPRRCGGELEYMPLYGDDAQEAIAELVLQWSGHRELFDPETLLRFCLFGKHRWGLFRDRQLVGINVGDENFCGWGIFRYCIHDKSPFLDEYMRFCFYISTWAQEHQLIDDGGDLDNQMLAKFKLRLHPLLVRLVPSYLAPEGEE